MTSKSISQYLPSRIAFLLGFATLLLAIALLIAWALGVTLFFPKGELASLLYERSDVIKAHIDFLMMSQFLFIFAFLFRQYDIAPPRWVIGASCVGAFLNPLSFLMRGLHPKVDPTTIIEPHFPLKAAVSFSLVTVGFLVSAGLVAFAAWRTSSASAGASASTIHEGR
jgi:hypothetical protein